MSKIMHLSLFLAVISALAGGALSFANQVTAPVIAENNARLERESLMTMYPNAAEDDFKEIEFNMDSKTVQKVYEYQDKLIFNMKVPGYKDGTTFLVSINTNDKTVDQYYPLSNGDTKGLGSKVMESDFINNVNGKASDDSIDTISGATISSSGVVNGINEASTYVDQLKGE